MKSTFQAKLAQHMLAKAEGFTLIELLVVIVIVGVLSAVAVPTFLNQVERSRFAEAQALLAGVRTGAEVWQFDFGSYPKDPLSLFKKTKRPDGTKAQYVDGKASEIAPNYTLAANNGAKGAKGTGTKGAYKGRKCVIRYGAGGTTCTQ
ncbi:MAG: prepilin-type N-terminal cleavage/methylation domain-containing protein [Oceanospirillales bacterium]|nr:MAG: prepilin-type N-terminal cleavage/methylation domain-containing protein [Oceanospirillales bacterium]